MNRNNSQNALVGIFINLIAVEKNTFLTVK